LSYKKSKKRLHAWSAENMVQALAAVEIGDMSERKAAGHLHVSRSSLRDRLKNSCEITDIKPRLGKNHCLPQKMN